MATSSNDRAEVVPSCEDGVASARTGLGETVGELDMLSEFSWKGRLSGNLGELLVCGIRVDFHCAMARFCSWGTLG